MKMKNAMIVGATAASLMLAATAWGGISGSKHDFSSKSWSGGEICLPCHAPHNNTNVTGYVLWNHKTTTAGYTMYSSGSMDASMPTEPSPGSKTCLSCHDGTVALDSFGGSTGTNFMQSSSQYYVGTQLGNDHPVSFTYNTGLASTDGFLKDPSTANSGLGSTVKNDLLINDKVECSSCHDVHNQYNVAGLLKKSNSGSALCITCHSK